jgi:K(+)-stimulated pyrophosphate-energized sodium pump
VASVVAIAFAGYLARWVLARDTGTEKMREVSDAIFDGAQAFLSRQYRTIALLAVVAAIVIGLLVAFLSNLTGGVAGLQPWEFALRAAVSFLFGAFCSGVAGYIGMNVAVRSNIRTASAAQRGVGDALLVSFRGGAVTGFLVIALSLLGVTLVYIVFGALSGGDAAITTPTSIVGFGFGASFVALFAQLGGGIYTKEAYVGADLVGNV